MVRWLFLRWEKGDEVLKKEVGSLGGKRVGRCHEFRWICDVTVRSCQRS